MAKIGKEEVQFNKNRSNKILIIVRIKKSKIDIQLNQNITKN